MSIAWTKRTLTFNRGETDMKINVTYIETEVSKTLTPCRYHMADGSIKYYYQLGE